MKILSKHQTRRRLLRNFADIEDLHQLLDTWFDSPLGAQVLKSEQELVAPYLSRMFGYHILQLGCSDSHSLIAESPVGQKIIFSSSLKAGKPMAVADNEELPLANDGIDVVLIHHALDFTHDSHKLLREAARVLRPGGQLLILGFNPLSPWGVGKLLRSKKGAPWNGRFISRGRVADWLKLLELHIEQAESCLHYLPLKWGKVLSSATKFDKRGRDFKSPFGGAYLLIATKQVLPVTPILPKWRPLRARATVMPAAENVRIKKLH